MDDTQVRREVAQLLAEARRKATGLTKAKDRGVLIYFIQMSLIEVLAQQSDAMEKAGMLVSDEKMLMAARRLVTSNLKGRRSRRWLRRFSEAVLGRVPDKPRVAAPATLFSPPGPDFDPLAELQRILNAP